MILSAMLLQSGALFAAEVSSNSGLSARVDENGAYVLESKSPAWSFAGKVDAPLRNIASRDGEDALGAYHELRFDWRERNLPMSGSIRVYDGRPLALFSDTCGVATEIPPQPFPSFDTLPDKLHTFSYAHDTFAPPRFSAQNCSTPWLLFDDDANALVISPASHFMVASMAGDGQSKVASGFNPALCDLPANFTQRTLLAFGGGINHTWDLWGRAITDLEGVKRPGNEADTVLKYFGYWTDNGADYYYNYDLDKGYAGTLEALVKRYRSEQIPLHYLQLDSWWYPKTFTGPDGRVGATKSKKLPEGEWNRYGGLLEYKASPALFPDGLSAFQNSIGLPLVTHSRWIDPTSPYHKNYKISGLAAVDPKWWNDIAEYLKTSGVITYEQDWCDRIYKYSPAFSSNLETAETFLNDMAAACESHGLTMQYCMPYPCFFLQGAHYPNLTTIRTSGDRFNPEKWNNFLYVSRLARSLRIWPWVDVFKSRETNNLLLATLSAGPVGTGDAIGREDPTNLFKSIRADGVIVKPDEPIVPTDRSYLAQAERQNAPLVSTTFTDHSGLRTGYVFAFNRRGNDSGEVQFTPGEIGVSDSDCVVFNWFTGAASRLKSGSAFEAPLEKNAVGYYVVAPIGRSGIAFLGDRDKFVSTGKQRIEALDDQPGDLNAKVVFAPSENSVTLHGYAEAAPKVSVQSGSAGEVEYDLKTHLFSVAVRPDPKASLTRIGGDPVRVATVDFRMR